MEQHAYVQAAAALLRTDPSVKSCVNRIIGVATFKEIEITENAARLNAGLQRHLNAMLPRFLTECLEAAIVCGFAPYTMVMRGGLPHFVAFPLGTFSWTVEDDPHHPAPLRYNVRYKDGSIAPERVYVMVWQPPCLAPYSGPLQYLVQLHATRMRQFETVRASERWNAEKHVAVTEKVDLKDPTTSGIQLLDDLRRYNLTGTHSALSGGVALRAGGSGKLGSVTEGNFHWLDRVFKGNDERPVGVHGLPPNMEVHELAGMDASPLLELFSEMYQAEVHKFFDMPAHSQLTSAKTGGAHDQISRQQYLNTQQFIRFLERVVADAYGRAFANARNVTVHLTSIPRLELKSIDDIKTLTEVGLLNPQDRARIRAMFME